VNQVTLNPIQIPSVVSYTNGVVKACGAEAMKDFQEDKKNVAYWFKVMQCPARSVERLISVIEN
jgi:hypothetical protein